MAPQGYNDREERSQPMSDLDDPRVFFAAERTLLAWNRTALTLMAFGFVLERFGLFLRIYAEQDRSAQLTRGPSFWVGVSLILLGAACSAFSVVQFRRVVATLKPKEIPYGNRMQPGVVVNLLVALAGAALCAYLFTEPQL
jgi:putative membrane protein